MAKKSSLRKEEKLLTVGESPRDTGQNSVQPSGDGSKKALVVVATPNVRDSLRDSLGPGARVLYRLYAASMALYAASMSRGQ